MRCRNTNRVSFVAVHPCCNAAELYEVKKLIGVTTLTSKAALEVSTNRVWLCCCASLL